MALFQPNVVAQYIATLDYDKVAMAYSVYNKYFLNPEIQKNIRQSSEVQFQDGFLRELFVNVLGYTINPSPNFNLRTEENNETDSKKADGAIIINGEVVGVIELKGCNTTDLKKVESQAFGYKNQHRGATYVIISNFEKLRFYIDNSVDFEEFNLFNLSEEEFSLLYLCLAHENIEKNLPKTIKTKSVSKEEEITNKLYKDYSEFKQALFNDILVLNHVDTAEQKIVLFKKTQKLLDRLLFIFFAEDSGLLTPNTMRIHILDVWQKMREMGEEQPLYNRIKRYFTWLNEGFKNQVIEVFAYNGGLFKPDEVLDNLIISDELLYNYTLKLSEYNYASEVDVNILGHIFEHSLTEIEEVTNTLLGNEQPTVSKRKKDGVFYTPQYITKYIVENTVGKLCAEKKAEMEIDEEEYFSDKKRYITTKRVLLDKLNGYREWLLGITICDPACGSGAFLNAALQFLINEHKLIDEMQAKITGDAIVFPNIENVILENNLYGVDINEESVEIAKLSLWLRTAQPYRKLSSLNNNIKCGNSLISDVEVAGDKAFDWEAEFPQVFEKGGFDVVIGNPPYVLLQKMSISDEELSLYKAYSVASYKIDLFHLFFEKSIMILKEHGKLGFITPNTYLANKYIKPLRYYILANTNINILVKHSERVFKDASVDVATIILSKGATSNNLISIVQNDPYNNFIEVSTKWKNEWLEDSDLVFNTNQTFVLNTTKCVALGDICKTYFGIQAFDRKSCISTKRENHDYLEIIDGEDIKSYTVSTPVKFFAYKQEDIKSGGDWSVYERERIVVRQIGQLPVVGISKAGILASNTLYSVYPLSEDYDIYYILSILNSSVIRTYWLSKYYDNKQLFPKIKGYQLRELPIPMAPSTEQSILSKKALDILNWNAAILSIREKFVRRLEANLIGITITESLARFDERKFPDFLSELRKQKIVLSLKQQDEWEEYFNDYKRQCNELSAQISSTDKEIDRMVYALYDLTEEEIAIVEDHITSIN